MDRLAVSECRRRGLRHEDADEFCGHLRARLAERGDAILAAHDGRSSIETYLRVVVARALQDWQRAEWGTWRPSAEAVRLGGVAIALETRLHRDGASFEDVVPELGARFGERAAPRELEAIRKRLPQRPPRLRPVAQEAAAATPGHDTADASLNAREAAEIARRIRRLLSDAVATLDSTDRLILVLVFRDNLSVRAAARALGLEHKRVGRRLERLLDDLRRNLESGGIDRHGVLLFLEEPHAPWDNPPAHPSTQEEES